jgi:hypothetical protein
MPVLPAQSTVSPGFSFLSLQLQTAPPARAPSKSEPLCVTLQEVWLVGEAFCLPSESYSSMTPRGNVMAGLFLNPAQEAKKNQRNPT